LLCHRPQLIAQLVPPLVPQALLHLLVVTTSEPWVQARVLFCSSRLAALCGSSLLMTGVSEGLMRVSVELMEAWSAGLLDVSEAQPSLAGSASATATASATASATATATAASTWHAAVCAAIEASSTSLGSGSLLMPYSERLVAVLLRVCLASVTQKTAAELKLGGGGGSPAVHDHYLPRLYACLSTCSELLPYALERGLLGLLLRLPPVTAAPTPTQMAPGPPGSSPAVLSSEAAAVAAAAAATAGLRALCSQWLSQPEVAGFVAAAVRSHLGMPPREAQRPTAMASVRKPTRGSSAATAVIATGSGVGGGGGKAPAARSGIGGGGGQVSHLVMDGDGEGVAMAAAAARPPMAEEPTERPSKKRRTGALGRQHLQQPQHDHGAKFGNLPDMLASQNAFQQRTQAEARGMRTSGSAGAGGGGNGGCAAEMEAVEGRDAAAKLSSSDSGSNTGGGGTAMSAALSAGAAVVVRFLVGLAPPHPPLTTAGDPEAIAAVAAVKLALLERFTATLLPPGCPELLVLVTRISCEWARRM
ncbi:hypothetical protein VaNZ11_002478, partial [Volvox africanus]